jgi:hypothetical protein
MNKRERVRRKSKSSLRSLSAIKGELEQLRDWAKRGAEVEFIVLSDGFSMEYAGRIMGIGLHDGKMPTFHFISQSGMHVRLVPRMFPKSSIEKIPGIHNGIYVEGKKRGSQGFSIVESFFGNKPNAELPRILEKLRTWEKLQLDLHVVLNRGCHAISFRGQGREMSPEIFSFTTSRAPAQLMVKPGDYKFMDMSADGDKSAITLIDPGTGESCLISDAATKPEAVFQKFIDLSPSVH